MGSPVTGSVGSVTSLRPLRRLIWIGTDKVISETKFNAWPETLKSAFAPARTLRTGKPSFRLALIQE